MAFLIYRNINFVIPIQLTEDEFIDLKKNGITLTSILPSIFKFNFYNFLTICICIFFYFFNMCFNTSISEAMWSVSKLVLCFWIPKTLIESFKYYLYRDDEKEYKLKLSHLIDNAPSYRDFYYEYDNTFIKSKFGKFLINKFIK